MPSTNPTISMRDNHLLCLTASTMTNKIEATAAIAETGPAGPTDSAFCRETIPRVLTTEPTRPIQNKV